MFQRNFHITAEQGVTLEGALHATIEMLDEHWQTILQFISRERRERRDGFFLRTIDPMRRDQYAEFLDKLQMQLPDEMRGGLRMPINEQEYLLISSAVETVMKLRGSRAGDRMLRELGYSPTEEDIQRLRGMMDWEPVNLDALVQADVQNPNIPVYRSTLDMKGVSPGVPPTEWDTDRATLFVHRMSNMQLGDLSTSELFTHLAELLSRLPNILTLPPRARGEMIADSDGSWYNEFQRTLNAILGRLNDLTQDPDSLSAQRLLDVYPDIEFNREVHMPSAQAAINRSLNICRWEHFRARYGYVDLKV